MSPNGADTQDHQALRPGDLIDEKAAAALLGASIQTLRNWRWKGVGPRFRKVGQRLVRYHRSDIDAFIATGTAGEGAAA